MITVVNLIRIQEHGLDVGMFSLDIWIKWQLCFVNTLLAVHFWIHGGTACALDRSNLGNCVQKAFEVIFVCKCYLGYVLGSKWGPYNMDRKLACFSFQVLFIDKISHHILWVNKFLFWRSVFLMSFQVLSCFSANVVPLVTFVDIALTCRSQ